MSKVLGDLGEDLACDFLSSRDYRIIERNYRTRFGEIDIIAQKKDFICFVEVKYKVDEGFGTAVEMISKNKMEKILKTAKQYLYDNDLLDSDWRIDVVAIDGISKRCDLLENVYLEGLN